MTSHARQVFLETFDREAATTMKVLRAYPEDKLDLKPSEKSKTAKELGFVFVNESYLGPKVWNDVFAQGFTPGQPPQVPETWSEVVEAVERALKEWRAVVADAPEEDLDREVTFFTGPKQMGKIRRLDWAWFLLHDQIHHRGQFTVYLRMAGGKVPSVYGPSADEPWV